MRGVLSLVALCGLACFSVAQPPPPVQEALIAGLTNTTTTDTEYVYLSSGNKVCDYPSANGNAMAFQVFGTYVPGQGKTFHSATIDFVGNSGWTYSGTIVAANGVWYCDVPADAVTTHATESGTQPLFDWNTGTNGILITFNFTDGSSNITQKTDAIVVIEP